MTKKMLIDATHEEETRVAVVDGNRLSDFDYESAVRKQLKGSIFLAKVTRVEPSLQAAFVNFGGNRHGFLPFSEIHPDYFRIPISDREALLAEQEAEMEARRAAEEAEDMEEESRYTDDDDTGDSESDDLDDDSNSDIIEVGGERDNAEDDSDSDSDDSQTKGKSRKTSGKTAGEKTSGDDSDDSDDSDTESEDDDIAGHDTDHDENDDTDNDGDDDNGDDDDDSDNDSNHEHESDHPHGRYRRGRRDHGRNNRRNADSRKVEIVGGDGIEGDQPVRPAMRKNYKIQEVVKRGQIMLIQVSKEERGNKGAAVGTYLSLPGRYCVLMPNSPRAGGVSRKIANFKERKRMREILKELNVPSGMSVIMRTAGVSRTKAEIKRDLDYLMKLWDDIRSTTLESTAPALIHEEGSLIRRAIRDIYTRDIDEIHVSGDEGYKRARDVIKMMIPSHAKKVKQYKDPKIPIFQRYQIESQISEIGNPVVTLPSGGYLVINPTEALVSIDVNSGRATKERHIEETALRTNMEAAEEVARQLRLRDLGGLVVVDFIDMENRRNNRKVENKIKDALSTDRARIQIGRISSFGLMELSRQRMNPSITEAQFEKCSHCQGIGVVRSVDATALNALRALEEEGIRDRCDEVTLIVPNAVALYILNNKRQQISEMEERYGFTITVSANEDVGMQGFKLESHKSDNYDDHNNDNDAQDQSSEHTTSSHKDDNEPQEGRRNRRGRRGGRNRRGRSHRDDNGDTTSQSHDQAHAADNIEYDSDDSHKAAQNQPDSTANHDDKANTNANTDAESASEATDTDTESKARSTRSKSPRGGRNRRSNSDNSDDNAGTQANTDTPSLPEAEPVTAETVKEKEDGKTTRISEDKPVPKAASKKTATKSAPKIAAKAAAKSDSADDSTDDSKADKTDAAKAKKSATKKPASSSKTAKDSGADISAPPVPSNDSEPVATAKEYERVNEAPPKKKKGWWSRSAKE